MKGKVLRLRITGPQISIAVVCLILGILLSVQFQTTRYYNVTNVPGKVEDLVSQKKAISKEKAALEQKYDALIVQLENSKNFNQALADLQEEIQSANLIAGYIPVEGPGIIIIVNDKPENPVLGDDPNNYLVHDKHLLMLVNELKAAGAEAISINNQRIIAMSEIRCAGTLININGIKTGPPFILKTIGNPDILYGVMVSKNGYLDYLNAYGLSTSIKKSENIIIPALEKPKIQLRSI